MLDVAAGAGHTAFALAPHVSRAVAVDLTEAMVRKTVELAAARRLRNVRGARADAERLPFTAASFDAVACRLAFHHFPNPGRALREFRRVLKPGGQPGPGRHRHRRRAGRGRVLQRVREAPGPVPPPRPVAGGAARPAGGGRLPGRGNARADQGVRVPRVDRPPARVGRRQGAAARDDARPARRIAARDGAALGRRHAVLHAAGSRPVGQARLGCGIWCYAGSLARPHALRRSTAASIILSLKSLRFRRAAAAFVGQFASPSRKLGTSTGQPAFAMSQSAVASNSMPSGDSKPSMSSDVLSNGNRYARRPRFGKVARDFVTPVISKPDAIVRPCVRQPPLAMEVAAVHGIQQVP